MSEAILVGGSKGGHVIERDESTKAYNNIVLNETKDGPEYIDLYLPTNVTDKDDRPIYVHVGRYDATESASYWATLSAEEKQALKDAAEAAQEEVKEDEEAAGEESSATDSSVDTDESGSESTDEEATEESAGEESTAEESSSEGTDEQESDAQEPEVKEEDSKEE